MLVPTNGFEAFGLSTPMPSSGDKFFG